MLLQRPLACLLVCLGPLFVACGGRDRSVGPTPVPPTEVRHDVAPLTSRFPALGAPRTASWVTWNSAPPGDRGVPGATTYWIDAVVELAPATATDLIARYRPQAGGRSPDVQDLLRDALPPGPYLTGAALDSAFTTPQFASTAYLDPAAEVVVVISASA
jgi:hypothetical protein